MLKWFLHFTCKFTSPFTKGGFMSHVNHENESKLFIDQLDVALEKVTTFGPIEKMAIRGCVTEVLAKYWQYVAEETPCSSIAHDVRNKLLIEMLNIENGIDAESIGQAVRVFNQKVPERYSLDLDKIVAVYRQLLTYEGRLKSVK